MVNIIILREPFLLINLILLCSRLELARRFSKDVFRSKSSGNLDARRFSSDINFAASRFMEAHSSQAIGRRWLCMYCVDREQYYSDKFFRPKLDIQLHSLREIFNFQWEFNPLWDL